MLTTVYGAFNLDGSFIRTGRFLTGSPASITMNLKNFDSSVEIRILHIAGSPAEAVNRAAYYTEQFTVKPKVKIKETILKNGSTIKRTKVNFAE